MKQGKRKIETSSKQKDMNRDDGFFLPHQKNIEADKEAKLFEGMEQGKDNLSDLFFLPDYPWKDD